jgi:hypothetical protein
MTAIIPITELRNTSKILELSENEPLFITKNGFGVRVMMNIEMFDRIKEYMLDHELAESMSRSEKDGGNIDGFEFIKKLKDDPTFR